MAYCPSGKACYRSWYGASKRLKYEKRILDMRGGEVYKCEHCSFYHITRHSTKKKLKRMGIKDKNKK